MKSQLLFVAAMVLGASVARAQPSNVQPVVPGYQSVGLNGVLFAPNSPTPGSGTPIAGASQYGLAVSSSTALTVPAGATSAVITVEGNSVRYTTDGTTPTASVGMGPVTAGGQIGVYQNQLSAFRIIQTVASATIDVTYYK